MHNRPFQKSQIWEISNHCCFGVEGKETYLGKTHFLTLVSIGPRTQNQHMQCEFPKKDAFVKHPNAQALKQHL